MIYNLTQLLRTQFPTETVYVNGRVVKTGQSSVPNRNLLVMETGGTEKPWVKYQVLTAQVIARDVDAPRARALAYSVFTFLTSRFGLELPQVTVGGTVFPKVVTAQISAIQVPYNLGPDEEGRVEYVCNYQVIKGR